MSITSGTAERHRRRELRGHAGHRRGHPASVRAGLIGSVTAALLLVFSGAPAGADPIGSFGEDETSLSCEGVTSEGHHLEMSFQADGDSVVTESYLQIIDQNDEHVAIGTPVTATFQDGVVDLTFDLADESGVSLGTAHLEATLTAGETVETRQNFRDNGAQWHSVMALTPYSISWETFDVGDFEVVSLDCTARHVDYETFWSEPHRTVFNGVLVATSADCVVAPMTEASVGLLPDNVEMSFSTEAGHGLLVLDGTEGSLSGTTYWFDLEGEYLGETEARGSFNQSGPAQHQSNPSKTSNVVTHTTPYTLTFDLITQDGTRISNECGIDVSRTRWIGETPEE